jgi:predicted transcriptional regulator
MSVVRYTRVYVAIAKAFDLTPLQLLLASVIVSLSRTEDGCWASKQEIAESLHAARSAVFDNLNKLARKGLIEKAKHRSRYGTSRYRPTSKLLSAIKQCKEGEEPDGE